MDIILINLAKKGKKTQAKAYDKIIKENLEALLLPLAELLLGINIQTTKKLTGKLQTTLEREPDFIRIVQTLEGEQFILHLEFQTSNESKMVYRMAEYHAILLRKYQIPIKQFVVYLGDKPPKMQIELAEGEIFTGYQLLDISALETEKLLEQEVPEAILLAILTRYDRARAWDILKRIYYQIKRLSKDETQLRKYLKQLEVLSRLRNLEEQTTKLIKEMPISYDITTDYLYNKGMEKGIEKGMEKGREKFVESIQNWLRSEPFLLGALTYEHIASVYGVTLEEVKEIHKELKKRRVR